MINSKNKGTSFEYEIRDTLKYLDDEIRRTVMSGAIGSMLSSESGDICTHIGLCVECKRTERLKPYDYYEQALRESKSGNTPVVAMRSNFKPALALLAWSDFVEIYAAALKSGYHGKIALPKKVEKRKTTLSEEPNFAFSKNKQLYKLPKEK